MKDISEEMKEWVIPDLELHLVQVQPGQLKMGSDKGEESERPIHTVIISKKFWMGKHLVTQAQYEKIMNNNPSSFRGLSLPVENVNWSDAVEFCKRLTDHEQQLGRLPNGFVFRLPTEAEWEYCCRAGSEDDRPKNLRAVAWYSETIPQLSTQPVGTKSPNAWGIFDMLGNVCEWCLDRCSGDMMQGQIETDTYVEGVVDPCCNAGAGHICRGGAWSTGTRECRYTRRWGWYMADNYLGFRVALAPDISERTSDSKSEEVQQTSTEKSEGSELPTEALIGQIRGELTEKGTIWKPDWVETCRMLAARNVENKPELAEVLTTLAKRYTVSSLRSLEDAAAAKAEVQEDFNIILDLLEKNATGLALAAHLVEIYESKCTIETYPELLEKRLHPLGSDAVESLKQAHARRRTYIAMYLEKMLRTIDPGSAIEAKIKRLVEEARGKRTQPYTSTDELRQQAIRELAEIDHPHAASALEELRAEYGDKIEE